MKRFLLSLVALVIAGVCFAQDIIVQKDGSTIQAKVVKVTQSEVEYKKFNNQNGPTYTISTKDLQCINYQNGTKDTFVSPNYDPNIVTNETVTQFSNDQQLLALYNQEQRRNQPKSARTWKITGIVLGSVGLIGGVAANIYGANNYKNFDGADIAAIWGLGGSFITAGAICYYVGYKRERKNSPGLQSYHIYQQEFNIGKSDRLMVGVDMLQDNTYRNQALGLGVSYHF